MSLFNPFDDPTTASITEDQLVEPGQHGYYRDHNGNIVYGYHRIRPKHQTRNRIAIALAVLAVFALIVVAAVAVFGTIGLLAIVIVPLVVWLAIGAFYSMILGNSWI